MSPESFVDRLRVVHPRYHTSSSERMQEVKKDKRLGEGCEGNACTGHFIGNNSPHCFPVTLPFVSMSSQREWGKQECFCDG